MAVYFAESLQTIGANLKEVQPTILVGVPRMFEKIYARIRERADEAGKLSSTLLSWSVAVAREYSRYFNHHDAIPVTLKLKHWIASRLVFDKWRQAFGGKIRLLLSGGAALSEELACIYTGAGIPIIQGYGLTETSPVITASTLEDYRVGTVGRVIPHVELRLAPDGEIEVRGPNVMHGYYNKPEETRAAFTDDGWFKTGDIVSLHPQGFIQIKDRSKDVIKSGGEWISSVELENALMAHPSVAEAAVIAIPDEKWAERPLAAVVLRSGATATGDELRDFLAPSFAKWWLPERIEFVDEIPKTSVGKFRKTALRERFAGAEAGAEAAPLH
jgi:long-subunit acyl-CoA synthetase (AMP-forming)